MATSEALLDAVEIINDRLYFITCEQLKLLDGKNSHYFTTDDSEDYHYERFYDDFGPLNLAVLHKFCEKLQFKLNSFGLSKKKIIYYTSSSDEEKRSNAAYLIGSFAIICLGQSAAEICRIFDQLDKKAPFLCFRDASPGESTYGLRLNDVFCAVEKAVHLRWIDFDGFDVDEYEYFERVENGDLNWIVPGKIIAFCGPHLKSVVEDGYPRHSPENYFDYFREHNVTNVVRLNKKNYDSSRFTAAGFAHDDLFFVDGSTPSNAIVLRFIRLIEEAPGAVAVHCKAGLGRTGTLIACYMMKHYGFTAPECMAWIRICRPGSIIGPQQQFLIHVQNWCRSLPGSKNVFHSPSNGFDRKIDEQRLRLIKIAANAPSRMKNDLKSQENALINNDVAIEAPKPKRKLSTSCLQAKKFADAGQGERLMRIKGNRKSASHAILPKFKSQASILTNQKAETSQTTPFIPSPGPKPPRFVSVTVGKSTNQRRPDDLDSAPRAKQRISGRPPRFVPIFPPKPANQGRVDVPIRAKLPIGVSTTATTLLNQKHKRLSNPREIVKRDQKICESSTKDHSNALGSQDDKIGGAAKHLSLSTVKNHQLRCKSQPLSKSASSYHLRSVETDRLRKFGPKSSIADTSPSTLNNHRFTLVRRKSSKSQETDVKRK